jgi:hypothetical protein
MKQLSFILRVNFDKKVFGFWRIRVNEALGFVINLEMNTLRTVEKDRIAVEPAFQNCTFKTNFKREGIEFNVCFPNMMNIESNSFTQ